MAPDPAHRFVADLDAAVYRHQLADERAIYLLVQVAHDVCIARGLDWSALMNHMEWRKPWRGHAGFASLPEEVGKGQFFRVWSLQRAKEK